MIELFISKVRSLISGISLYYVVITLLGFSVAMGGFIRPLLPFVLHVISIIGASITAHFIWKWSWRYDFYWRDTIISALIIILLLEPSETFHEALTVLLVSTIAVLTRVFTRIDGAPLWNPAVISVLTVSFISYSDLIPFPMASWWGTNYSLPLFGQTLPLGTMLSIVLMLFVVIRLRKWRYAIAFFFPFIVGLYYLRDYEGVRYTLLDGTIYFFFGVMACEPKTAPSGRILQTFMGIVLSLLLLIGMYFHLSTAFFLPIFIANFLTFLSMHLYDRRKISGKDLIHPKGQKWLCVPCGYIYDPLVGDEDSGIVPGTEFEDIPSTWRCPVCGVRKSDFIPYNDEFKLTSISAQIIRKTFLNPTTIELIIATKEILTSRAGQFVSFLWLDKVGEFRRSYSIASAKDGQFTFLIKLTENGRASKLLRVLGTGDKVRIIGVFGAFILQDTVNPKVFIATGTGLAPIYAMLQSSQASRNILYFSVATKADLFYEEKLRTIRNLEIYIHITREDFLGYEKGRVGVDKITMPPETEWYLCGNPRMVEETKVKLIKRGIARIYSEEFN